MTLEWEEIQGIVLSGYGDRPCARFVPFAIADVDKARAWLGTLAPRLQYASFLRTKKSEPPYLAAECLNVALTYEGLARLGLARDALLGFSGSFRGGMAAPSRARQLGDDGASAPETWRWGGPNTQPVHGVLLVYTGTDDGDPDEDERCAIACTREVRAEHGVTPIAVRDTLPMRRDMRAEHFGFADGISNPKPRSLAHGDARDVIADGEVVLGYPNVYGKLGLSPLVTDDASTARHLPPSAVVPSRRDFGRNGSYLVFRELQQDVASFWRFMEEAAARLPEAPGPVWLASRMIGRWPSGLPVTQHQTPDDSASADEENAFDYHPRDPLGTGCPIGAHIRRTNPRDTRLPIPHDPSDPEGGEDERKRLVDRHRLVRRGRSFGPRRSDTLDLEVMKEDDGVERGLHFLCVVANLRRQFEFVQGTWVVNPSFAGLSRDPDPLLAAQRTYPFEASSFVLPGCPARFVDGVPRFVEVRGGAYFFLPSRSALGYLAALGKASDPPSSERLDPADEQLVNELELRNRGKVARDHEAQSAPKRALRAFHSRSHGIVRGVLEVDRDLPSSWQSPLFRPGARYPAWVRFSSGRFGAVRDDRRDVHGLAMKLMNVPDLARAAPFEAHTHDFVLIDAPRLFAGTLEKLAALERALDGGRLALLAHFLRNPRQLRALRSLGSVIAHPLARTYNSITPFAFGDERAVRWVVRLARGERLVEAEPGATALRDALARQLAAGPVALELCVQNRGSRPIPLEDASVDWRVPEERLATLTLQPEGFGEPAQEELGDQLAFNPWNALSVHRPLGALNLARKLVYRSLAELRRELDGKLPREPRPWDEPS